MSLSNKALLANLTVSQWTGRKLDKQATNTVATTHQTKGRAGNYTKKLLPESKELEAISTRCNALRTFFYDQTLPWYSDGSRILSSKNYLDFTNEFKKLKADFDHAVDLFLVEYPALQARAANQLGNLFNNADYPSVTGLRTLFSCNISLMPIPAIEDFRVEILDSEKQTFITRMRDIESAAMKDCWNRLYSVVSKATQRLSDPDAIFKNTLIENITDICALLPKLNVTDDATLESMRTAVESAVSKLQPDTLRDNMHARKNAVNELDQITSKMSAIMGAF